MAVGSDYTIRGGRQKLGKAKAEDPAYTARLKLLRPGIELATTLHYQEDITQNTINGAEDTSSATLFEIHTILNRGPFSLRALYAHWNLDAAAAEIDGRDVQKGFFIEPSLKLNDKWGVFARYNVWDQGAGDAADSKYEQFDIGFNFWLHENVVFKFDYQSQQVPEGKEKADQVNLGFGYSF